MAPALLERGIQSRHLTAVGDSVGYDSGGDDDTGRFGLQDAREAENDGAGWKEKNDAAPACSSEGTAVQYNVKGHEK